MVVRKSRGDWKIHANVFDKFTEQTLFKLSTQRLFDELRSAVALGKEANIFVATPGRGSEKKEHVIVKIYRLENCNFRHMFDYLKQDARYANTKPARRAVVFAWAQREYRNLMIAREVIHVPTPRGFKNNVLIMDLVGNKEKGEIARQLKDLTPEDPEKFLKKILSNMKALWDRGLAHGDLSAFNILNHNEEPIFIDFSQASPSVGANGKELLQRDLKNIANHFKKLDVTMDIEKELERITS